MNIKVDFDNIVVKEDKNDFNVKVLMLKGEKGDQGDGEPNVIEKVQVNGTDLTVTNKTVNVPVPVVDSSISSSSTNPVQNKAIYDALSDKVDTTALNNYYEISEVDDMVNNKADASIVDKKPYYFDSVAEMKAYDLQEGDYAITKGYYTANDGGGANYEIVDDDTLVDDGGLIHVLTNGLRAKLLNTNIYPELFGAKGDGITDDTTAFENAINKTGELNLYEKTYKITSLTITKDLIINGNNATLIDNTEENHFIEMLSTSNNKNLWLHHINIDTPHCNVALYIDGNKLNGDNIIVKNAKDINIHIVKTGSFGSCNIDTIRCQLAPIGVQLDATDCHISHFIGFNCMKHLVNNGGLTHINSFHGWNYNENNIDWITGSTLIETTGSLIGNDVYIDTLENGIVLPNNHPYTSIILQNVSYFLNRSSYPATQQAPTLLKNVENFTGFCRIDGFYGDENSWTDENDNYPTLIDNIDTSKITLTNVTNSGFRFNRYKPIETNEDIQITSYQVIVGTYVAMNTRKVKYKNYDIHAYMKGNMKTGCASGNIMHQASFIGQQLNNLNIKTRVRAIFVESSNDGVVYDLPAYIDNNARLTIYNNTGVLLGGAGHYGELHVYIDDIHQTN